MAMISELNLIKWSKRVFKVGYIYNRFMLYVGAILMLFIVGWFFQLWVTKKGVSLFNDNQLVSLFEQYIIQKPSFGLCFLAISTIGLLQIYFTSNFFKFLGKLMHDLYSYRYNNYDLFNIENVLQDIIITIKKIFIIEVVYLLVLGPLIDFLFDEKYFLSVLKDKDTDSSNVIGWLSENFGFSLVALIILYLLFSVLKDLLKYKNEYHAKADQLEKENALVI